MKRIWAVFFVTISLSLCGCGQKTNEISVNETDFVETYNGDGIDFDESKELETALEDQNQENYDTEVSLEEQEYGSEAFSWIYEEDGVLIDNQYLEEIQLREVMNFLENLPDDVEALVNDGGFILTFVNVYGSNNLDSFQECYEQGQPTSLLTCKYTDEGDVIFYYLMYDGEKNTLVVDTRRDKWAKPQIFVTQHSYFSILEQVKDENLCKTILLHNDPGMTAEKWLNIDPMNPEAWEGLWQLAEFSEASLNYEK